MPNWMIARTPVTDPYPCRCTARCGNRCPCKGRTDIVGLPRGCCAYAGPVSADAAFMLTWGRRRDQ